ncbi:Protein CBG17786 [Caenorhabditis briggsae]|uniref:Protein CBG17786 n=1 Tax=Caenorhabditis briggsae TaxID=6238 RepID=A8XRT0_CAEBR|nr:Protein CBG17786 [Caenorhabditis briggsae]CAP35355.2 Protein CBG17786 [Caenorhabditis briggsae]
MNQRNVGEDAQELRLRDRIMQLRQSIRTLELERQRIIEDVRGAEPQDVEVLDKVRGVMEHTLLEWSIARNERIRHLQQFGDLPPDLPEIPLNPVNSIVRDNRFPRLLRQLLRPPNAVRPPGRLIPGYQEGPAPRFDVWAPRFIPELREGPRPVVAAPEAPVVGDQGRVVGPEGPREVQPEEDPEDWIEVVGGPHPQN